MPDLAGQAMYVSSSAMLIFTASLYICNRCALWPLQTHILRLLCNYDSYFTTRALIL